jgi:predicted Zn-dependent protease with MMP-like domain
MGSVTSADRGASGPERPRTRRDRHGRGLRGVLLPAALPGSRTRAQRFDDRVLDVVEHLERHWSQQLRDVEFAVEDVPYVEATSADDVAYDADVLDDGAVPLARVIPGRVDSSGATVPPRIVLYRRPLEARAVDDLDLDDLVHDVVVEQVANLLGMPPEEIDPSD